MKVGECVGTLTKSEILICQKRVRLVPPDATVLVYRYQLLCIYIYTYSSKNLHAAQFGPPPKQNFWVRQWSHKGQNSLDKPS